MIQKSGFTLIELLVVITILAVLAGAALPYVQSYVAESRISKAKADLDEIGRALAVYETREGEYTKSDVSDLTGRYLNKAPIDPWGMPYYVATSAGLVVSFGPDRELGGDDDITYPYQPPLALVQVKWVDANQSGAVDTQNGGDKVLLYFSRRLHPQNASGSAWVANLDNWFDAYDGNDWVATPSSWFVASDPTDITFIDNRVAILKVKADGAFTPGRDALRIAPDQASATIHGLRDQSNADFEKANLAISNQKVIILPQ